MKFTLSFPEYVTMFKVDKTYNNDVTGFNGIKIFILDPEGKDRMTYDKADPNYLPYACGYPGDSIYFDKVNPTDGNKAPVGSFTMNIFSVTKENSSTWNKPVMMKAHVNVLDQDEHHKGLIVSSVDAVYGTAYNGTVEAAGSDHKIVSYKMVGGQLPEGMTFGNDGILTGTPVFIGEGAATAGIYTITIEVTHDCGKSWNGNRFMNTFVSEVVINVAVPELPPTPVDPPVPPVDPSVPEIPPAPVDPSVPPVDPPVPELPPIVPDPDIPISGNVVPPTNGCIMVPL